MAWEQANSCFVCHNIRMKLFPSVYRISLHVRPSGQFLFTAFIIASIVGIELAGRHLATDLEDASAALMLGCLMGLVATFHKRRPLVWVHWLRDRVDRFGQHIKGWKYEYGIDFRGSPAVPRKIPASVWWLTLSLIVWTGTACVTWYIFPSGWRDLGLHSSYVVYLVGMCLLWGTLIAGLFLGMYVPLEVLNRKLRDRLAHPDRRALIFVLSVGYGTLVLSAAALLNVAIVVAMCALAFVIVFSCYLLPQQNGVSLLWRSDDVVYSIPMHRVMTGMVLMILLILGNIIISATGGQLFPTLSRPDAMSMTNSLGALMAWTAPGLLLLLAVRAYTGRHTDPAGHTPPTFFIGGNLLPKELMQRAAKALSHLGWFTRTAPTLRKPGDIALELVPPELSEATDFYPYWPLKIALPDFDNRDVLSRLVRRDELQLRNRFLRRMKQLLGYAVRNRKKKGGGYWFAPHWWFIEGLGREERGRPKRAEDGEGALSQIGPSYQEVFGTRVRQYIHQAFRALEVDVMFIEDGVKMKSVMRVLRNMFEVYDIHGGTLRVEDHHFMGIPKVSVAVLDFSPDKEPTAVTYKEPKFDDLSRGRVIHIARDRGESEEVMDTPLDFSWEPAPMSSM